MSKVTPNLEVAIPRNLAAKYGIHPGDSVRFRRSHGRLHIEIGPGDPVSFLTPRERMRFFESRIARERRRGAGRGRSSLFTSGAAPVASSNAPRPGIEK